MLNSEFRSTKMRNNSSSDLQRNKPNQIEISVQSQRDKEDATCKRELLVLGFSLDSLPRSAQFLICCGGVFLFYLIYGYVQVSNEKRGSGKQIRAIPFYPPPQLPPIFKSTENISLRQQKQ